MRVTDRRPSNARWLALGIVSAVMAGLLASAPADAAPRKGRLTLAVSEKKITEGRTVTFTTTARRGQFHRGDLVRLQRRDGASWRTVRTTRLDRSGRSVVKLTPAVGSQKYRAARSKISPTTASATVPVDVTPRARSRFELRISEQDAVSGSGVLLTGVTDQGYFTVGDPVEAMKRPFGEDTWTSAGMAPGGIRSNGRAEALVTLEPGRWEVQLVRKRTDRFAEVATGASGLRVDRGLRSTLRSRTPTVSASDDIHFTGHVDSSLCDGDRRPRFVLQQLSSDGYWPMYTDGDAIEVDDDCDVTATTRARAGVRRYRIKLDLDARPVMSVSNMVTVDVTPERPPVLTADGPATTMFVDVPDQVVTATFTARAGQRYALAAERVGLPHDQVAVPLRVLDPRGVAVDLDGPLDGTRRAERWDFSATTSGLHTVELDPRDGSTGDVRLRLSTPSRTTVEPDADGTPVSTGEVSGRELDVAFRAEAGRTVALSVTDALTWDPATIRLVREQDGARVTSDGRDGWRIPSRGSYRFEVEPRGGDRLAASVAVVQDQTSDVTLNSSSRVVVDRPGRVERLQFGGTAGQRVTVAVPPSSTSVSHGSRASIRLTSDDGTSTDVPASGFGPSSATIVLDQSGRHTLDVRLTAGGTGSLRIDLSTPVVSPIELDGASVAQSSGGLSGRELAVDFEARGGDAIWAQVDYDRSRAPLRQDLVDVATGDVVAELPGTLDLDSWTIPHDGRYRLVHQTLRTSELDVSVRLRRVRPSTVALDSRTTIDVSGGRRLTAFRFTAPRDEVVTLSVPEQSLSQGDVQATPTGFSFMPWYLSMREVGSKDYVLGYQDSPSRLRVRAGQTYEIVLDSFRTGSLTFDLTSSQPVVTPATLDGTPVTVDPGPLTGRAVAVRFDGTRGDLISLDLSQVSTAAFRPLFLRRVDGGPSPKRIVDDREDPELEPQWQADPLWAIEEDGAYEIVFEPRRSRPGTPQISVHRAVPTLLSDDGFPVTASVDEPGGTVLVLVPELLHFRTTLQTRLSTFAAAGTPGRAEILRLRGDDSGLRVGQLVDLEGGDTEKELGDKGDGVLLVLNPAGAATGSVELRTGSR